MRHESTRFTDAEGREWNVPIHAFAITELKNVHGVELLKLCDGKGELLSRLHDDPVFMTEIIWTLIADQAGESEVSEKDFKRAMRGDALHSAWWALMNSIGEFWPAEESRNAFLRVCDKLEELSDKMSAQALDLIKAVDFSEIDFSELLNAPGTETEGETEQPPTVSG